MAKPDSTDFSEMDQPLKVLDSCLCLIKWRLRPSSKRRLQIDCMALCTRMRPVVMVDYGGKMPELQERLCALLKLIQKESPIFEPLRVMVIEDMIYLIHVRELAEHVSSSLNPLSKQMFVDLEQDPPKMVTLDGQHSVVQQLVSIQKIFSLAFSFDEKNDSNASAEVIDLSHCMQDTEVTVPTLNGWLLGYPVVYLFGKEHIDNAVYNLSTKSLHLFKILTCRNGMSKTESWQEELMSFSVPYDLSLGGSNESWAKEFYADIQAKCERCEPVWKSLEMEVSECNPLAIVL